MKQPPRLRILTLTGASGSGKTTLVRAILKRFPKTYLITSFTTRPARETDLPGEYAYVSAGEFNQRVERGEFIWTAEAHEYRYGTTYHSLQQAAVAKGVGLMILVPERIQPLWEYLPDVICSLQLLSPGPEELERRLLARGDDPASVTYRVQECLTWDEKMTHSGIPLTIVRPNDTTAETLEKLAARIE